MRIEWHVGDVVRKLREAKRWNQARLAEVAQLNKGTVVSVEEGANVKVETMESVAKALGLTMAQLYGLLPKELETRRADSATAGGLQRTGTGGDTLYRGPNRRHDDSGPPSDIPERRRQNPS